MSPSTHTPRVFYGWYVAAASFLILFLNSGGRLIIGVMVKPVATDFGWSRSAISAAVFLNLAVYAVSIAVTGRLYDRYGPKWVIAASAVLFSAGYALMAGMDSLWEFLLYYGVLNAAGLGGTTVSILGAVISNWFAKRRGLVISLAFAGSCLGQFVLVPIFSDMIQATGWRSTTLWIAIISIVLNLALAFGVIRGDPGKLGLRPYGSDDHRKEPADTTSNPSTATIGSGPRDLTLAEAMRTPSLWLFTTVMFVCGGADFLVTTHLVPMVTDYGLPNETGAAMLAWLGLLSLPGILLAGPAADLIGNKIPIAVTFALRVALFAMLVSVKGAIPFWVFSLGFGFTILVTAPLCTTLVVALYGVSHVGFISGFITTIHMVGGGLWAYLGGVIFDRTGDYDLAFVLSAALSGIAVLCTFFIREKRHLPPGQATAK